MPRQFISNQNTTAARMAGGPQGAASGRVAPQPQKPVFGANPSGYGAESLRMTPIFKPKRYDPTNIARTQYDAAYGRQKYQMGREVASNDAYDTALNDPRAQSEMFQRFYADSANATAAPILRQFQQILASNNGMNASRFGGQGGSTEQARGEFNVSDVFSRNLGEIIQQFSSGAVDAGMRHTGMLGERAGMAQTGVDNTSQIALQAGQGTKKKGGGIGGFLGGVAGAGAGALLGNPAFGAAAGQKIFGG